MAGVIDRGKSYKKGGTVAETGPAFLHKGETVVPKGKKRGKKSDCFCKSSGMKR